MIETFSVTTQLAILDLLKASRERERYQLGYPATLTGEALPPPSETAAIIRAEDFSPYDTFRNRKERRAASARKRRGQ